MIRSNMEHKVDSFYVIPPLVLRLLKKQIIKRASRGRSPTVTHLKYWVFAKRIEEQNPGKSGLLHYLAANPKFFEKILENHVSQVDRDFHSEDLHLSNYCPICGWWFVDPLDEVHLNHVALSTMWLNIFDPTPLSYRTFSNIPLRLFPAQIRSPPDCREYGELVCDIKRSVLSKPVYHMDLIHNDIYSTSTASNVLLVLKQCREPIMCGYCKQWIAGSLCDHRSIVANLNQLNRFKCKGCSLAQSFLAIRCPWVPRTRIVFRTFFREFVIAKAYAILVFNRIVEMQRDLHVNTKDFIRANNLTSLVLPFLCRVNVAIFQATHSKLSSQNLKEFVKKVTCKFPWTVAR